MSNKHGAYECHGESESPLFGAFNVYVVCAVRSWATTNEAVPSSESGAHVITHHHPFCVKTERQHCVARRMACATRVLIGT